MKRDVDVRPFKRPRLLVVGSALFIGQLMSSACRQEPMTSDRPVRRSAELVWSAGGADAQALALSRLDASQVSVDSTGRIYVLGASEMRVYVLDSLGNVRDSLGRSGQGPGEFDYPVSVHAALNGGLAVVDLGLRRIVKWRPDGALDEATPIADVLYDTRVVVDDTTMVYVTGGRREDGVSEFRLTKQIGATRVVLTSLEKARLRPAEFPSCNARGIAVLPLFAPVIHWSADQRRTAYSVGTDYRVVVASDGNVPDTLSRPLPPMVADSEAASIEAADWLINGCKVPPLEVVRGTGFLEHIPPILEVRLAPLGEVWIGRRSGPRDASVLIDVFDRHGVYLGTMPDGTPMPAVFLGDDRFLSISKDSVDIPVVSLYRILRD